MCREGLPSEETWRVQCSNYTKRSAEHKRNHAVSCETMPRRKPNPGLTERARQCAEDIIRGYESKQSGQRLGISYRTVAPPRRRIFTKTGCRNAVELLRKM